MTAFYCPKGEMGSQVNLILNHHKLIPNKGNKTIKVQKIVIKGNKVQIQKIVIKVKNTNICYLSGMVKIPEPPLKHRRLQRVMP